MPYRTEHVPVPVEFESLSVLAGCHPKLPISIGSVSSSTTLEWQHELRRGVALNFSWNRTADHQLRGNAMVWETPTIPLTLPESFLDARANGTEAAGCEETKGKREEEDYCSDKAPTARP